MTDDIDEWLNDIHVGDARETLAELPASSVHMVMTSPPYWQLRDYGDGTVTVWGGDEDCPHEWTVADEVRRGGSNTADNPPDVGGNQHAQDTGIRGDGVASHDCQRCGAWRGQFGLEPTREQYVENLVTVFREIRRVLRPDGSAWLNLGDTYKDKQKNLVPHRVAIALQADGWIVRNDVTWLKPNPMPSSVKDRLNTTTEQVFYLRPQPDGWFDLDAIREPYSEDSLGESKYNWQGDTEKTGKEARREAGVQDVGGAGMGSPEKSRDDLLHPAGKNPGDVFEVTTKPFPEAHFAVYPPELCETPIKATCPPRVCADCGAPYEREVDRETVYDHETTAETDLDRDRNDTDGGDGHDLRNGVYSDATFEGWTPTCDCDTDATAPGIALDPFAGAGTTCRVAKDLGRRFIGIDLNAEYVAMAQKRVGVTVDEPDRLLDADATTLQAYTDGGGGD